MRRRRKAKAKAKAEAKNNKTIGCNFVGMAKIVRSVTSSLGAMCLTRREIIE